MTITEFERRDTATAPAGTPVDGVRQGVERVAPGYLKTAA
ncbi:hypothetical protein ACVWYO_001426 [Sphingomonas sp. UYP23]